MRFSKGNLSGRRRWILVGLLGVPLLVMVGKLSGLPVASGLSKALSLVDIPDAMVTRARYLLFVPLGAVIVVFFRLTLGIRLLGPFRSILIAVAFQVTGVGQGLVFLVIVIAIIVAIRPFLKMIKLPYFGRVSVILSTVAALMVLALLAGGWLGDESLLSLAYFPVVVLSLIGEGFSRTLYREGIRSALWRGATTVAVAVLIARISEIPRMTNILLRFPELLVLQIGLIVLIAEYFDLRLLKAVNPLPKTPEPARRKGSAETSIPKGKKKKKGTSKGANKGNKKSEAS